MNKSSEFSEERWKIRPQEDGAKNGEDFGRKIYMDTEIAEKYKNSIKSDSGIGGKFFLRNEDVLSRGMVGDCNMGEQYKM